MPLIGWERLERTNTYYKACVAGATAAGAISGMIVSGPTGGMAAALTVPAGTAMGFVAGYVLCPYLAPAIRDKFERDQHLTDQEVRSAAEAMSLYSGVRKADEAVRLLALVRATPAATRGGLRCANPVATARQLLHSIG